MRAIYALVILAILYPALPTWTLGHLTITGTTAAVLLLARHRPHHSHPIIAALIGATIATWITGHHGDHA